MTFLIIYLIWFATSIVPFRRHCEPIENSPAWFAWPIAVLLAALSPVLLVFHLRKVILRAVIFPV